MTKWRDVVRSGVGTICTDEKEVAGKLKIDTFQIFLELKMLFVKYPRILCKPTVVTATSLDHPPFNHLPFIHLSMLTFALSSLTTSCFVNQNVW